MTSRGSVHNHTGLHGVAVSCRGFVLVEAIAWIGLLGIVAAVAMPLFRSTFRILHDSAAKQSIDVREDVVLQKLRSDVWAARSIELVGPHAIRIRMPDDKTIIWEYSDTFSRLTRRSEDSRDERGWDRFGVIEFAIEGPMLKVRVVADGQWPDETRVLVSQFMLLGGDPR
jgi:hypothetical protein